MAQFDPLAQTQPLIIAALCVAFFSASQDISINAYTTDVLTPEERGLGAAYIVFAYRVALLVSGGLALVFADMIGWRDTYLIMALIMFLLMIPTFFAPHSYEIPLATSNLYGTILEALSDMLQRENI